MRFGFLLLSLLSLPCGAQSPRIKVYFNQDTDPTVSTGTLAISLHTAMDDTIEAYIDRAQYTIDVAVYNADDISIMYALNQAYERGVQVRYITEGSTSNNGLSSLSPFIPVHQRTDGEGSGMHNKFLSIDADHADLAWIMTGSTNWSQNGLFTDYNNIIFIQDQALALAYRTEFEEMWGGSGPQPVPANSKFGADKTNNTQHVFDVDGVQVECWFSPSDGTTSYIVDAIEGALSSVHSCMFSFTNDDIGSALLAADELPNCTVYMDLEDEIYPGTEGWYLFSNGVSVVTHNTDDVQLHHKYGIIDHGTDSDPSVITGSHNWTWNAELINDENTLIIHDATIANLFYQEWHARRNDVVGIAPSQTLSGSRAWPTPADRSVSIALPTDAHNAMVELHDIKGRSMFKTTAFGGTACIDVHTLPAGAYVLIAQWNGGAFRQAILVAH